MSKKKIEWTFFFGLPKLDGVHNHNGVCKPVSKKWLRKMTWWPAYQNQDKQSLVSDYAKLHAEQHPKNINQNYKKDQIRDTELTAPPIPACNLLLSIKTSA